MISHDTKDYKEREASPLAFTRIGQGGYGVTIVPVKAKIEDIEKAIILMDGRGKEK